MVQGYLSLEEAAQFVGITTDELRQMAQKKQIRSFQDRGTLRFRVQDIHELARQRGASSDLDLPVVDSPPMTPQSQKKPTPETFDFSLEGEEDSVNLGLDLPPVASPSSRSRRKSGDSDVRLPHDDSLDLPLKEISPRPVQKSQLGGQKSGPRSPSKLAPQSGAKRKSQMQPKSRLADSPPLGSRSKLGGPGSGVISRKPSGLHSPKPQPIDSGVRLVPMDLDSDDKILGASSDEIPIDQVPAPSPADSDVRLERYTKPAAKNNEPMMLTDEINLDEEISKQQPMEPVPQAKVRPKSKLPNFADSSPFELSAHDLKGNESSATVDSSDFDLAPQQPQEDPSDFDLAPAQLEGSSDFELNLGSSASDPELKGAAFDLVPEDDGSILMEDNNDDFSLELPDDFNLAETQVPGASAGSRNLADPDELTLEPTDEDVDFSISIEPGDTPRPQAQQPVGEGSEDFELSLDDSQTTGADSLNDTSSEFELTLDPGDAGDGAGADSDSEFELTLDDSSQLVVEESGQGKDIFETDFDVSDMGEESGSQVVALDTDLDSSNFEFDADSDDMSGSMVVALDEEEGADLDASGFEFDEQAMVDVDEDEEDEKAPAGRVKEVVREKLIKPAPWGALPVFVMLPCMILMILVAIVGFEVVQSSAGYKPAGFVTKTLAELLGQKLR